MDPDRGDRVTAPPLYNACLIGAELVALAWLGRVSITEDAVIALEARPLGNAGLDRVLHLVCLSSPALPLHDYTRPWRSLLGDPCPRQSPARQVRARLSEGEGRAPREELLTGPEIERNYVLECTRFVVI